MTAQAIDITQDINLDAADSGQFLTFMLAGEEYGVDILRVQEIKGWEPATAIPNTPSYMRGVINLRGTIVPVIDLRERMGLVATEYDQTTVVIVLKTLGADKERTVGFVVDAVSEVYLVRDEQMSPAPDLGDREKTRFVKGLATVEDKMLIMLDVDHLVCSELDGIEVDTND